MAHNGCWSLKLEAGVLGAGYGRAPVASRAKRAGGGFARRAVRDSARKMGGNLARGRMLGWGPVYPCLGGWNSARPGNKLRGGGGGGEQLGHQCSINIVIL